MSLSYDDLLTNYLGGFGTYQILIFLLLGWSVIPLCLLNVGVVFLAAVPEHWCKSPSVDHLGLSIEDEQNLTVPYDYENERWSQCIKYDRSYDNWTISDVEEDLSQPRDNLSTVSCDRGWTYSDEYYGNTVVSEWNLVCNDRWLQPTAASAYILGLALGVGITGALADVVGRKPVLCFSCLGLIITASVECFAGTYITFIIIRLLIGFANSSVFNTSCVLCIEIVSTEWRGFVGIMLNVFWVVGYVLIPAFAYYLRDWTTLQAAFAATCLPCIIYFWVLSESPRWLYARQRGEEADKVVRKFAKINKSSLPPKLDVTITTTKPGYFWELFRTHTMLLRSANTFYIRFAISLVYYGLSLNSTGLSGNPYINVFLSGIVELPAYLASVPALNYFGRRLCLNFTLLLAGLALLLTLALPNGNSYGNVALVLVGKFGISAAFAIIFVVIAEVFPTTLRNSAISVGSYGDRSGAIIAPFIGQLAYYGEAIPIIIFGACAAAAGVTSMFLPETKGVTLPETLEVEVEENSSSINHRFASGARYGSNGEVNPGFAADGELPTEVSEAPCSTTDGPNTKL